MTHAITLTLRSTDECRNAWRRGALRYAAQQLRQIGEHRAADILLNRALQLADVVPDAAQGFEVSHGR